MKILICGVTGSIGLQSIDVIGKTSHKIVGVVFNKNIEKMNTLLNDELSIYKDLFVYSPNNSSLNNCDSIQDMILKTQPDLIINAVSGFSGLSITLLALKNKIDLANANKESFVAAGWLISKLIKEYKINVYPIDSEHSAICDLLKNSNKPVSKILITASGGPFYKINNQDELDNISFDQAVKHPKWNMGYKISIDSSTLMNKCFEIIEAKYLFNTSNIEAVYHPQAIVHSMIEFGDNSVFAHLSHPDMKLAISLAINKFNSDNKKIIKPINFSNLSLDFDTINVAKWKPIKWAYDCLNSDSRTLPLILISANDACVELFKNKKIKYTQITSIIEECISAFLNEKIVGVIDVYRLHSLISTYVYNKYNRG